MPLPTFPPMQTAVNSASELVAAGAALLFCVGIHLLRCGIAGHRRSDCVGLVAECFVAASAWVVVGAAVTGSAGPLSGAAIDLSTALVCSVWAVAAGSGLAVAGTPIRGRMVFSALCGGLIYPVVVRVSAVVPALVSPTGIANVSFHVTCGAAAVIAARLVRRGEATGPRSPATAVDTRSGETGVIGSLAIVVAVSIAAGSVGICAAAAIAAVASATLLGLRLRNRLIGREMSTAAVAGAVAVLPQATGRPDSAAVLVTGVVCGLIAVVVQRGLSRGGTADGGAAAGHLAAGLWGVVAANVFGVSVAAFPPVFIASLTTLIVVASFGPVVWLGRLRRPAHSPTGFIGVAATSRPERPADRPEPEESRLEIERLRAELSDALRRAADADSRSEKLSARLDERDTEIAGLTGRLDELTAAGSADDVSIFADTGIAVVDADDESKPAELDEDSMWQAAPERSGFLSDRPTTPTRPADRPRRADEAAFATLDRLNRLLDEAVDDRPTMSVVRETPIAEPESTGEAAADAVPTAAAEPTAGPAADAGKAVPPPADDGPACPDGETDAAPPLELPDIQLTPSLLDTEELRRRCLGDEGFFSDVLEQLSRDLPGDLAAIETHLGREDFGGAAEVASRIGRFAGDAAAGELHAAINAFCDVLKSSDWDAAAARYVVAHDSGLRTIAAVRLVQEGVEETVAC